MQWQSLKLLSARGRSLRGSMRLGPRGPGSWPLPRPLTKENGSVQSITQHLIPQQLADEQGAGERGGEWVIKTNSKSLSFCKDPWTCTEKQERAGNIFLVLFILESSICLDVCHKYKFSNTIQNSYIGVREHFGIALTPSHLYKIIF